jgi:hypothetical protein
MKTQPAYLTFLFLSFFFSVSVLAQDGYVNGYVIRKNNDTIRGMIKDQNWDMNPRQISFKEGAGTSTVLSTHDIKEFAVQGKVQEIYRAKALDLDKGPYELKELSNNPVPRISRDTVFATLYESGTINLYFLRDETDRYHYMVEKNDTGIQDLGIQRYLDGSSMSIKSVDLYKNQLNKLMSDCGGVILKLGELPYREKEIRSLVRYYNGCVKPVKERTTPTVYSQEREKVQVYFGLMAGLGFRKDKLRQALEYHPLVGLSLGPSINIEAGIWSSIVSPRTKKRLEICEELVWNYFDQKKSFTFVGSGAVNNVEIAAHMIRGNALLRYSLPIHDVKLAFLIGGSVGGTAAYVNRFDSPGSTGEAIPFVNFQWAMIAGAGVNVKNFRVELRYLLNSSISYRFAVQSIPHSLNLTLLYGFSLMKDKQAK